MNIKIGVVLIAVLALVVAILLFPNDEKEIRKNLDTLAEYCSSPKGEATLALVKKGALAARLCTDPCMVHMKSFHIDREFTKKEFTDHMLTMKRMLPETHFTFHDTTVSFPEENLAELSTTLKITGKVTSDRFTDAYELNIQTKKIDGDWLFSSFSVIEFMEQ